MTVEVHTKEERARGVNLDDRRTGALPCGEAGSPRGTWWLRSSPQSGGKVWSYWTCGSAGAHLGREAGSGAVGHVAASEPTSTERQSPEL
jgi:hypothetical protein